MSLPEHGIRNPLQENYYFLFYYVSEFLHFRRESYLDLARKYAESIVTGPKSAREELEVALTRTINRATEKGKAKELIKLRLAKKLINESRKSAEPPPPARKAERRHRRRALRG